MTSVNVSKEDLKFMIKIFKIKLKFIVIFLSFVVFNVKIFIFIFFLGFVIFILITIGRIGVVFIFIFGNFKVGGITFFSGKVFILILVKI